jgi:ubiquinone/menaquinone biosynthesis C-methylase UbiE
MSSSASPTAAAAALRAPTPGGFAETYERVLVPSLFRPWAEELLGRVPLCEGARVLDVACGTGIVARVAHARLAGGGRVVGVDRSAGLLAVAQAIEPSIDWRIGDAARLPVPAGEQFDAVTCSQGLQFFADRAAAVREMRRVLAPGGRVGVAVWRSLEENGLLHDVGRIVERFAGPIHDQRHGFADADALGRLLVEADFDDVLVEPISRDTLWEIEPAAFARLSASSVLGMSPSAAAMPEGERAALVDAIVEASLPTVARAASGGAIRVRTAANIATGRA